MIGQKIRVAVMAVISGFILSCTVKGPSTEIDASPSTEIQEIRVVERDGKKVIEIEGEEPMIYTTFHLADPDRLVIDMAGVSLGKFNEDIQIEEGPVRAIRPSTGGGDNVARLELLLADSAEADVRTEGLSLVVEATPTEGPPKGFRFFEDESTDSPGETPADLPEEEDALSIEEGLATGALKDAALLTTPATLTAPPASEASADEVVETESVETPGDVVEEVTGDDPSSQDQTPLASAKSVHDISFVQGDELELTVGADGKLSPSVFFVDSKRLVIDLPGVRSAMKSTTVPADHDLVKQVRIGRHPKKLRLVVDLVAPVTYAWAQDGGTLRVRLQDPAKPVAALSTPESDTAETRALEESPGDQQGDPVEAEPPLAEPSSEAGEMSSPLSPSEPAETVSKPMEIAGSDREMIEEKMAALVSAEDTGLEGAVSPSSVMPPIPAETPEVMSETPEDPAAASASPSVTEETVAEDDMREGDTGEEDAAEMNKMASPPEDGPAPEQETTAPPPVPETAELPSLPPVLPPAPPSESPEQEEEPSEADRVNHVEAVKTEETAEKKDNILDQLREKKPVPPTPAPVKAQEIEVPKEGPNYVGKKVSLDFQDAEITNVIRLIAEVSKLNFVMSEDVKGKVTLKLTNVPWDQALAIILEMNNLGQVREGNIIRITTMANLAKQRAEAAAAKETKIKAEDLFTRVIYVNYAKAGDMKSLLEKLLSPRGEIMVDTRTNSIIVKDIHSNLDGVEGLATRLDTKTPQVLIEARIAEVKPSFLKSLGIKWGADFKATTGGNLIGIGNAEVTSPVNAPVPDFAVNLPASTSLGGIGFTFGRFTQNPFTLDLRLSAGETQSLTRVVSTPKIMVLDNHEALIEQGESVPFSTVSQEGTQVQFIDANLTLRVTPHISPDGGILLDVHLTKNEAGIPPPGAPGPPIFKKEVTTNVLLMDGETMVIGGIYETTKTESEGGIPWLKEIPVIGWLFKNKESREDTSELLVFLTPKVMD
ncbi:MAG: type IV pilus secretin PilQ [Nitrospiria bacterium]